MATALFLLGTTSAIWCAALAWFAARRAKFRHKLAAMAGAILVSGPLGFVLVLNSIAPANRGPGAGIAALQQVMIWAFMALACLAFMLIYFAKTHLETRTRQRSR